MLSRAARREASERLALRSAISRSLRLAPRWGVRISTTWSNRSRQRATRATVVVVRGGGQDLSRRRVTRPGAVELAEEGAHDLPVVELDVREREAPRADDPALADMQRLDVDLAALAREGEDVPIDAALGHDLLALDRALDRRDPVAQARGVLVALLAGRRLHLALDLVDELPRAPAQEEHRPAHLLRVRLLRRQPAAGSEAALHLVLDTGPPAACVVVEGRLGARPQRKEPLQLRERALERDAGGIGPEILGPVLAKAAHHRDARPVLALVDAERQVLLVVAEADVEGRPVLLDQLVFEQQRFLHVPRDDDLDRGRPAHERRCAW
jgi:hypothetical protein